MSKMFFISVMDKSYNVDMIISKKNCDTIILYYMTQF